MREKPETSKNRIGYFDTLRFFAAGIIFATHYIAAFSPDSFHYFHILPFSIILDGISGKLGVAMLCVILGYFAYRKGACSSKPLVLMIADRYLFFVLTELAFFLLGAVVRYGTLKPDGWWLLRTALKESFSLGSRYYAVLWSLRPMLFGSVIAYILGRLKAPLWMCAAAAVIPACFDRVWLASCILGAVLYRLGNAERLEGILGKKSVRAVIFLSTFLLIRQGGRESSVIYLLDALFSAALCLVIMKSPWLQKKLEPRRWKSVARTYFGIYLLHPMILETLGFRLLNSWLGIVFPVRFLLVFLLLSAIIILLAIPLTAAVNAAAKFLSRGLKSFCFTVSTHLHCIVKKRK